MQSLKILFLCFCLVSSFGFAEGRERRENKIPVVETTVQNDFPNVFRPVGNFFKRLFGKRRKFVEGLPSSVTNLILSQTEIAASCPANQNSCSGSKEIGVYTTAIYPEGVDLIYVYQVSGGKIIGKGSKVIWDLTGIMPGTYKITAGVVTDCGVCGVTQTRTVKVIECSDCRSDEN